jgi:hypothetical protein
MERVNVANAREFLGNALGLRRVSDPVYFAAVCGPLPPEIGFHFELIVLRISSN